jgi:hypothetical protein
MILQEQRASEEPQSMVSSVYNWVSSCIEGGTVQASTTEWVAQKTAVEWVVHKIAAE